MASFFTVSAFNQKQLSRINAVFRFSSELAVMVEAREQEGEKYCKEVLFDFDPVVFGGAVCAGLAFEDQSASSYSVSGKDSEGLIWLMRLYQVGSSSLYANVLKEMAEKGETEAEGKALDRLQKSYSQGNFRIHLERMVMNGEDGVSFLFPLRWIEMSELAGVLLCCLEDGLWYLSNLRVLLKDRALFFSVGSGKFTEVSGMVKTNLRHGLRSYISTGRARGWTGDGFNFFTPSDTGQFHLSVNGRGVRLGKLESSRLLFLLGV